MLISLLAVIVLGCIAWFGSAAGLQYLFGVIFPLVAVPVFLGGFIWRMLRWFKTPVPFNITTSGGQQRSLDWIRPNRLDSPYTETATIGRMILEVATFRSLFRNTRAEVMPEARNGSYFVQWSSKWLWVAAIAFHYTFLLVFIRHFRFFLEPVPVVFEWVESLDGIMQVGSVRLLMSGVILLGALLFLLGRRIVLPRIRYISLPSDYFPLFLLIGLVGSGICMRYFGKTDIASVKQFIMGLVTLSPVVPAGISPLFYVHIFLLSVLLIYFPFSKLMHAGGIFLSPTRNMPNNSRAVRHINPWNPPKKYRTYAEYEDEFRPAMAEAGLPLEKEPDNAG